MRTLSAAAIAAICAQETGECFLALLTVSHPSMTTFRVVNNTVNVTSRGNVFTAFPFEVVLPNDDADRMPQAEVRICNISRDIIGALRGLTSPQPTVKVEIVLASQPDTVELGPFDFSLQFATYDAGTVSFRLGFEPILNEPFPGGSFTPDKFPALFDGGWAGDG